MLSPLNNALLFLIQTLFGFYLFAVLLRILLQWVHADYYNPLSQFVIKLTDVLVLPLRNKIPNYAGLDIASVTVLLALTWLKLLLIVGLQTHGIPSLFGLIVWGLGDILSQIVSLYTILIFGSVILSWINNPAIYPLVAVVSSLCDPFMKPLRRIIKPIGVFDLTPWAALIGLQLVSILMVQPLVSIGMQMA